MPNTSVEAAAQFLRSKTWDVESYEERWSIQAPHWRKRSTVNAEGLIELAKQSGWTPSQEVKES